MDLNLSSLKWCSLNNCNWCVSLDISYILALSTQILFSDVVPIWVSASTFPSPCSILCTHVSFIYFSVVKLKPLDCVPVCITFLFHASDFSNFFFFRVLHTMFSHLRAHAFALSVTVARSSAVQASSSRRQERRWAIVCGSPQSQSTDWASSR